MQQLHNLKQTLADASTCHSPPSAAAVHVEEVRFLAAAHAEIAAAHIDIIGTSVSNTAAHIAAHTAAHTISIRSMHQQQPPATLAPTSNHSEPQEHAPEFQWHRSDANTNNSGGARREARGGGVEVEGQSSDTDRQTHTHSHTHTVPPAPTSLAPVLSLSLPHTSVRAHTHALPSDHQVLHNLYRELEQNQRDMAEFVRSGKPLHAAEFGGNSSLAILGVLGEATGIVVALSLPCDLGGVGGVDGLGLIARDALGTALDLAPECLQVDAHIYIYVYIIFMYTYIHIYMYIYIHVYIYIYICIYICIYIYIYIYI